MWIAEKVGHTAGDAPAVQLGIVSIGGEVPAVVTDGELRQMRILAPNGVKWVPKEGDTVLCVQDCVIGAVQSGGGMQSGELRLQTGSAAISLHSDGSIRLTGTIYVNGSRLGEEVQ